MALNEYIQGELKKASMNKKITNLDPKDIFVRIVSEMETGIELGKERVLSDYFTDGTNTQGDFKFTAQAVTELCELIKTSKLDIYLSKPIKKNYKVMQLGEKTVKEDFAKELFAAYQKLDSPAPDVLGGLLGKLFSSLKGKKEAYEKLQSQISDRVTKLCERLGGLEEATIPEVDNSEMESKLEEAVEKADKADPYKEEYEKLEKYIPILEQIDEELERLGL